MIFLTFLSLLNRYRLECTAITLSLWGLYLRVRHFAGRDLFIDETNQIKYGLGPLRPFWINSNFSERTAFPGDYLLTYPFIQMAPANKWVITLPHIIAAILSFYLLYLICKRHFKTLGATVITFIIFGLNQNLVYHAFEIRPYALLIPMGLACWYIAGNIVGRIGRITPSARSFIGLFLIGTVVYHAYGILMIALSVMYFAIFRPQGATLKDVILDLGPFAIAVGILAVPLFVWYALGNPEFRYAAVRDLMNTFDYIPNPLVDFDHFYRTVFSNLLGYKTLKWLTLAIPFALLLPNKNRFQQLGFLLVMIILPIELLVLSDLYKGYWFLQRQFVWVMPYYAILIGWCWDSIFLFIKGSRFARKASGHAA